MAFDFPSAPANGATYTPAGGPTYTWDGGAWTAVSAGGGGGTPVDAYTKAEIDAKQAQDQLDFVNVPGDTMTGFLTLNANPTAPLHAAPKQYVDLHLTQAEADPLYVNVTGDAMTGPLTNSSTINAIGNITTSGHFITASGIYEGSAIQVSIGLTAGNAGNVYLRPNGWDSPLNEVTVEASGLLTAEAMNCIGNFTCYENITCIKTVIGNVAVSTPRALVGTFSSTGATKGWDSSLGRGNSSSNTTASSLHYSFYNTNGAVGNINTLNSATAYVTSSDENLKNVTGDYSAEDAIAIIRADPVKSFTWKVDGEAAIGWLAQRSYAINNNLAVPPPEPAEGETPVAFGEPGYEPWGIDYGRRTPYLWAALSNALDRIEALEAQLLTLMPASASTSKVPNKKK